jgi:hypothetical protein
MAGRAAFDGRHGSMKPEGRRKTMGEGPEIPLASAVKEY